MRLLLAVLAGAAVFTPEWAMGGWGVDLRLPAVLGVLAFATCEFHLRQRTIYALVAVLWLVPDRRIENALASKGQSAEG